MKNTSSLPNRRTWLAALTPRKSWVRAHLIATVMTVALAAGAQEPFPSTGDSKVPKEASETKELTTLTPLVEELRWLKAEKVMITTVSKRLEDPFRSAAAVSVITSDEIRRSGARSIPEALRLAPGLSVASMDANKWAISSRGFNNRFADKLLILIDGRSVYTPTMSGVFWDVQDYLLEDIDRIEVVHGPGGTLWGANAVNGVINIITKHSANTTGSYFTGGYGTEHQGFGSFRYGTQVKEDVFARGYFKYRNHDEGQGGSDGWDMMQGGFRTDWYLNDVAELMVKADVYYASLSHLQPLPQIVPGASPFPSPAHLAIPIIRETYDDFGANLIARYEREYSEDSELVIQAYFDRTDRSELYFDSARDTYDLDIQHRVSLPYNQNLMYGVEYRYFPDYYRTTRFPRPSPSIQRRADGRRSADFFRTIFSCSKITSG